MPSLSRIGLSLALALALTAVPEVRAQAIDAATRRAVVDTLARTLEQSYAFPDIGNRMAADLRAGLGRGEFDRLTTGEAFARGLTERVQGVSRDKHLRVRWTDGTQPGPMHDEASSEARARMEAYLRRTNYGFERVERLPGNVGYLDLRGFVDPDQGRATALAALRFLGNVDALIVDLRRNGGGDPAMVALISSVLFPRGQRVHLNDLHWREGNRVDEFYTDPDLDLPRITGEVYVLTSGNTFSAAEEFTYNLKQLKRATQVGETTGGGANPGQGVRLGRNFAAFIPTGHAVNPISKDNWEGKGAVPEIAVPAKDALRTAHLRALDTLRSRATDPGYREQLDRARARVESMAPEGWEGE